MLTRTRCRNVHRSDLLRGQGSPAWRVFPPLLRVINTSGATAVMSSFLLVAGPHSSAAFPPFWCHVKASPLFTVCQNKCRILSSPCQNKSLALCFCGRQKKKTDLTEHTHTHTLPPAWESGSESVWLWYRHLRPCHCNCQQGRRRVTTALNTLPEQVESRFRPCLLLRGFFLQNVAVKTSFSQKT